MNEKKENRGTEFDPSTSREFYENLESALELEEDPVPKKEEEILPEVILPEDIFSVDENFQTEEEAQEAAEEEMFLGVDAALNERLENEFGSTAATRESIGNKLSEGLKMIPKWTKVLVTVILSVLLFFGFLFGTKPGRVLFSNVVAKIIFSGIDVVPDEPTTPPVQNVTPGISETPVPTPTESLMPSTTPGVTMTPTPTPEPIMDSEDVINILLLGVENIFGETYGRSDSIMVASLNKKTGEIGLVSFLRDTYVKIPGHGSDRLNAAYSYGGAKLIMETIEENFRVDIDSYVIINFEGFEALIDELGGIKISLTPAESEYLNTTRYISNPEERNTVAGVQTMSGSQVLGYCRVRKVPTANGLQYDYGRTYRQRTVLKAVFDKYKEKNLVELYTVMKKCFSYVTAPASLESIAAECLQIVMEHRTLEFETLQIPAKGYFKDATIGGQEVLSFYPKNIDILQEFLYGEDAE